MKEIKKILLLGAVFFLFFGLLACDDFSAQYYIGYDYDQQEFVMEDVRLQFHLGISKKKQKTISTNLENVCIYVSNNQSNIQAGYNEEKSKLLDFSDDSLFFVREISTESFLSDDYLIEQKSRYELYFCNHSEIVIIPREMFTSDNKAIYFALQIIEKEFNPNTQKNYYHSQNYVITIAYELVDDKIIIKNKGEIFHRD